MSRQCAFRGIIVAAGILALAGSALADAVQLDISSGFTMDCIVGPLEMQEAYWYDLDYEPGLDVWELQGKEPGGGMPYSHTLNRSLPAASTEAGFGEPWSIEGITGHPVWLADGEGLPESGVVTGADRTYHMAGTVGNATLAGDWTEVADPFVPGVVPPNAMPVKANAVVAGSHSTITTWQINEAVAVLPAEQRKQYSDINFVMSALGGSDRAMHMEFYVLYGDGTDEQLIWAGSHEQGGSGPQTRDVELGNDITGWQSVVHWTACYNLTTGETGGIRKNYNGGDLYEFTVPVTLDDTKTLYGLKIVDSVPGEKYDYRGLAIYAATALEAGAVAGDPDQDTSLVSAGPGLIPSDDTTATTITVVLKDSEGTRCTGYSDDIDITPGGTGTNTVGTVTETGTGIYEAEMTSDTPGDKTLVVTVDLGTSTVTLTQQPVVTVYDAALTDADQSVVSASPSAIPDTGAVPSTITVELKNAAGDPVSGLAADITLSEDGTPLGLTLTETGTPGTYETDYVNTTAATYVISAEVAGTPPVAVTDTATVEVYTPGTGGYPKADAGADIIVTDTDRTGAEDVTLDGSASYDDGGSIVEYTWTQGGALLAQGASSVALVTFNVGVHEVLLTVEDDSGHVDIDLVTVTVAAADDPDKVQLDISGGFTMDAFCGPKEMQAIYTYAMNNGEDPDRDLMELQGGLPEGVGWYVMHHISLMVGNSTDIPFSIPGAVYHPICKTDGQGTPESGVLAGADRYYHIASVKGNDTLPGDWTEAANPQAGWPVPPRMEKKVNVMAVGCTSSTDAWQIVEATAVLPPEQRRQYSDLNLVLAAFYGGERARNIEIHALYGDGSDAEVLYAFSTEEEGSGPRVLEQDGTPDWQIVCNFKSRYANNSGSYGTIRDDQGDGSLYEFITPLTLNAAKTLYGIKVVDTNPSLNYVGRGLTLFGATATAAGGTPLEVTAALAAGEDWVYQNTETTTDDRHTSLATITLVSEASPGEVYNVSIADNGPGTNFTLGAVVDNRPGQQTLTVPIIGGRVGASTPGTAGAAYTVTLTVEGQTSTQTDTADVTLALRYIGDVDGSGAPGAQDKQFFNQRLNNVATPYPDRCYDLNGSGGAPNAEDKQVMNQVLNGVALP